MRLEDLVAKLAQIEEQAALTLDEYPHGLTVERQRMIVTLAKQLRLHVEDQLRMGPREPLRKDEPSSARASSVESPSGPEQATGP